MTDKLVLAYRAANGLHVNRGLNGDAILKKDHSVQEKILYRCMQFSNSGRFFGYCDGRKTYIFDVSQGKDVFVLDLPRTVKIIFSPSDKIVVFYQQYAVYGKTNDDGVKPQPEPNVRFYSVADGSLICAKEAPRQSSWRPQFAEDEKFCVMQGPGSELHFYENNSFERFARKGVVKGLETFELGPGLDPLISCFIPSSGGKPGIVQLRVPYDDLRVICQKTSFNCDTCNFSFNSRGSAVLATTTVDVDKTNQSYYGVSCVYLLTKMGEGFQVHLSKEGPLHALQWSPNGNSFIACFGYMPPKISIFNMRASVLWTMGESHKNELYFNPFGTLLAVCGFGNLAAGKIEVWDVEKQTEVCQLAAPGTTYFAWAPDGQHFVTATTSPRLRVDNNFRIWHYTGELKSEYLSEDEEKKPVEMWQVMFKPAPHEYNKFKIVEPTAAQKKKAADLKLGSSSSDHPANKLQSSGAVSQSGRYVPPALRKAANDGALKKNGNSRAQTGPKVELSAEQKQLQKLKKKIDDIQKLKKKLDDGAHLEMNQMDKIAKLPQLEQELASLKLQTNGAES